METCGICERGKFYGKDNCWICRCHKDDVVLVRSFAHCENRYNKSMIRCEVLFTRERVVALLNEASGLPGRDYDSMYAYVDYVEMLCSIERNRIVSTYEYAKKERFKFRQNIWAIKTLDGEVRFTKPDLRFLREFNKLTSAG